MKKLLFAMTALPMLAMASPAFSQTGVSAESSINIQNRIARIQDRIEAGIESGAIDRTEARNLRLDLRQIVRLERRYSRNGLNEAELDDLQERLRDLRQDLRLADGRTRWRGDDDEDDFVGQGGPIEAEGWVVDESCERSTGRGIGAIFSSVLGGGSCLRVGQRVTANMYAVPYEYRNLFRDNEDVYFRSDGRGRIYEIDARTQTVVRVYARDD